MTAVAENLGLNIAIDRDALKRRLRAVEQKRRLRALALVLPLFLFILLSFVIPIGELLRNAVFDPSIHANMPLTVTALTQWDGKDLPDEAAYAALATDLAAATKAKTVALVGKRLNYEISGIRSKILTSGRKAALLTAGPYKDAMIGIDKVWGERDTWAVLKRASQTYTSFYVLDALDLGLDADGKLTPTGGAGYLHHRIPAHPQDQPDRDRGDAAARLSAGLSAGDATDPHQQPADDPGAAAVLDLVAGADHRLVRAAAG